MGAGDLAESRRVHAAGEQFAVHIWKPACGDGSMARVLEKSGNRVVATDLYYRGHGEGGIDFLTTDLSFDNIVTNPPYNSAEGFIRSGLAKSSKKFALLLRLAFLEGSNRYRKIFSQTPPSRVWIFSERITFYPAGAIRKGSGTTAYAWFVWDRSSECKTELKWFKPGYKARYRTANPTLFK
ncbi:hypothetical protein [Bradyrhizobium sp. RDM4]|uniref:hypothetical protein n=1 Tax=Bradyrhizobium sp. RDM4 TaxID=3378765 RepID=UPI0038FBF0F6